MPDLDIVEAIPRDPSGYWLADGDPPPFRPSALRAPTGAELADDPAAQALREFAADPGGAHEVPATGWRLLGRSPAWALFYSEDRGERFLVRVKRDRRGRWEYYNSAYFFESLRAIRDGNEASDWQLDPSAPSPAAADSKLRVLVTEIHCASGRSAEGRIEPADVFYSDDEVRIVAYVTALPGPQNCPGNPQTPAVFVLPEPIGERRLVDAGQYRL
jgi:hypothetical protein